MSQVGRFASNTDPVHSTKLSQLGQNCPNKSALDNFVHGDVGLWSTGWLACVLPYMPAITNVYICRLYNGSGLPPVSLKINYLEIRQNSGCPSHPLLVPTVP